MTRPLHLQASCIPTQPRSLEEEDGKSCMMMWENGSSEALCDGERLARGEAPLPATAFKEFSLSAAAP